MGQEILYCYKCQTRLLGSDFDKGKAFKIAGKAGCAECVKDLIAPTGDLPIDVIDPVKAQPKKQGSTGRIPLAEAGPDSSSKHKPVGRQAPASATPPKSSTPLMLAIGGAVLLVILAAFAMSGSGSGPSRPTNSSEETRYTPPPPPPPPSNPLPVQPPPPPPPPRDAGPAFNLAVESNSLDAALMPLLDRGEFKQAIDHVQKSWAANSSTEWTQVINERRNRIEGLARKQFENLKVKALAARGAKSESEVKKIREQILAWGFRSMLDDYDRALPPSADPVTPPPTPAVPALTKEIGAYRLKWTEIVSKPRDYAAAQKELKDAQPAFKEAETLAEIAADLENLRIAGAVSADLAAFLPKFPKGQRLRVEYLNEAGARAAVEGPVLLADLVRLSILRDRDPIDLPLGEVLPGTLADIYRARPEKKPESDGRAAALFCLLEGDAEGARRHLGAGEIENRYWEFAASRPAANEAEAAARKLFWALEEEFPSMKTRLAATEKLATLLAAHEKTAFVARNRAFLAARMESARDLFLFPEDLTTSGTFIATDAPKLGTCWVTNAESLGKAKDNFVELEFYALAGTTYRAWVHAGGCCQEVLNLLLQATELTMANPRNSKETLQLSPGADQALPLKLSSSTPLKKWHANHGGPKEPARWEWIPVALPKFSTPGLKKIRFMTEQQGAGIAYVIVSAARSMPPREAEMREIEKSRLASAAPPPPTGTIFREFWTGIPGVSVSDLTRHPSFAGKPAGTTFQNSFEAPSDVTDNFGCRMRGWVHPPATGTYTFWIAGDDGHELWLSADDTPARKVKIAGTDSNASALRAWDQYPQDKSAPIPLAAGRRYYIEALQKEGGTNDHLAVGWQLPDGTMERPIPGKRLSPSVPGAGRSGLAFYRGINLGGPPIEIDGHPWEGKGAANLTMNGKEFEIPNPTFNPPTDPNRAAMLRNSVWNRDGLVITVTGIPAGAYQLYVYTWEDNDSQTFDILVQGKPVLANFASGSAGHWDKLGPWAVTVTDGKIEIRTTGPADANFSGIEIWKFLR